MVLLLAALLAQATGSEIESLVRDLSHDLIEVREEAHRKLLEAGEKALPALLAAATSPDIERRTRAASIAEIVGREARERPHDAAEKATLLRLNRDEKAEARPGSGASEGARFDLVALPFEEGWIVATSCRDYLARRIDDGPGRGRLRFDVRSIEDGDGRELEIERCGRCSPRKVFIKGAAGKLKVRLEGSQTWFSPYSLEFKDPADGHTRRIGDFTIEVNDLSLKVSSAAEFPYEWIRSMNAGFSFELKDGQSPRRRPRGIG